MAAHSAALPPPTTSTSKVRDRSVIERSPTRADRTLWLKDGEVEKLVENEHAAAAAAGAAEEASS